MSNDTITIPKTIAEDVLRYVDAMDKMVNDFDLSKWGVIVSHYLIGGDTDSAFKSIHDLRRLLIKN